METEIVHLIALSDTVLILQNRSGNYDSSKKKEKKENKGSIAPSIDVIYHAGNMNFQRYDYFMQGTWQFDLINVMNDDVNHDIIETYE